MYINKRLRTYKVSMLFVVCLASGLLSLLPVFAACPSQCTCKLSAGRHIVYCTAGLTSCPPNLPSDTEILTLSPNPGQPQNTIRQLDQSCFTNTTRLTRLVIRRSRIRNIASSTFSKLTLLTNLDLKANALSKLDRDGLRGIDNLVFLDISDNKGCSISRDAFVDLSHLQYLRLAGVGLSSVVGLFVNLGALKYLDLHRNNLFRLHASDFTGLASLQHLDISFNDLYSIDQGLENLFFSLDALDLDSNPWRCNCAFTWVKSLPRKFVVPSGGGRMPVVCALPSRLAHTDVIDVPDAQMICSPAVITSCTCPVTVSHGDTISITCDVEGDPYPDVTWYRPDGTQVQADLTFNTADAVTLIVNNADYSLHHGQWQAKAVSYNSSTVVALQVTVLVTSTTTMSTPQTSKVASGNAPNTAMSQQMSTLNTNGNLILQTTTKSNAPKPSSQTLGSLLSSTNIHIRGGGVTSSPVVGETQIAGQPTANGGPKGSGSNNINLNPDGSINDPTNIDNTNSNTNTNINSNRFSTPISKEGNRNNNNNKNNISNDNKINRNIVILVAIVMGALICMTGIVVFGVTIYKTRIKRKIHARRRKQSSELYRYTNTRENTQEDIVFYLRPASSNNNSPHIQRSQ